MGLDERPPPGRPRGTHGAGPVLRAAMVVAALSAVAVGTTSCVFPGAHQAGAAVRLFARTRRPALPTSVLAGAPDVLAAGMAKELFLSAPVVVIASTNPADVAKAAARAG